ncbi:hypothetical protein [Phytopseudomonas seleniipraecipitans]|uniref:EpsG family protein n=1 Tax=Phytopseudomonas seleniipraecipitans TaxID=640205 RepID=A0A1G7V0J5_9GAMM|nr:hypothetical protein [Pseudomonas seleniipraecipitans]SDG53313.1 hypothetical protein SAMN05216381_4232 [Pseudomonas seleniipraecipitans]
MELSANWFRVFFIGLLFLKALIAYYIFSQEYSYFGGANDADYYNQYALGQVSVSYNYWSVLLRHLNDFGFYSRGGVTVFLGFTGFVVLPIIISKLAINPETKNSTAFFWLSMCVVSAYPTLAYFATDVYRDVFMVFVWVMGCYAYKLYLQSKGEVKVLYFVICLSVGGGLYFFRSYLGGALLLSFLFSRFYSFQKAPLLLSVFLIYVSVFVLYAFGLIDPLLNYRGLFGSQSVGASNLGIQFSTLELFFQDFTLSMIYQMFGFYFVNRASLLVFIFESIPFLFFFFYIILNRRYSNAFVDFLIVFFVLYSLVWLLGNDNLGTAVRLRMYSYLSVFVAFCVIFQNKMLGR